MRWWQRLLCHGLDWHVKPKAKIIAGINTDGYCIRCGRRVRLDSMGNWYAVEERKRGDIRHLRQ